MDTPHSYGYDPSHEAPSGSWDQGHSEYGVNLVRVAPRVTLWFFTRPEAENFGPSRTWREPVRIW